MNEMTLVQYGANMKNNCLEFVNRLAMDFVDVFELKQQF